MGRTGIPPRTLKATKRIGSNTERSMFVNVNAHPGKSSVPSELAELSRAKAIVCPDCGTIGFATCLQA